MKKRILVIGSSNTDMIIKVDRLPAAGETVIGGRFSTAAGGKGANQAVAAARAGGDVMFITRLGNDMFGDEALAGFICDDIDVSRIIRDERAPSGVALICVDRNGENCIAVASGANANLTPDDINSAAEVFSSVDIVLMQLEIPVETVAAAARLAYENDVRVILNPAPAQPLTDEILRAVSILTPNESEAQLLTGIAVTTEEDARKAAYVLLGKGVDTLLLTLGASGVVLATNEQVASYPAFEVECVDTTAAGDVFNGALAVALAEGCQMADAVRFASAAAALSVTKIGAQPSAPWREQIEELLG